MKILVLSYFPKKHSHRQHQSTIERLPATVYYYNQADLEPFKDNLKVRFGEIYERIQPDVVLCYASQFFITMDDLWSNMKCLKGCIEPDYHNFYFATSPSYKKQKWYNQFDFVALRNGNDPKDIQVPTFWWPWSADEKEFEFGPFEGRRNIIGFAGSSVHELYKIRKNARDQLVNAGFLEDKKKSILKTEYTTDRNSTVWMGSNGKYQKYLRSIRCLMTSTENRGPFAKTFEAMSSGALVLTSPIINKELLFGDDECYIEYQKNCSNIKEMALMTRKEPALVKGIIENAYKIFMEKHTTSKRVNELFINIQRTLEGKGLLKMWGF
jgi:glycosyltransferase involved in cell wall biosynthesis